jgi:uncharacterized protein (DUF302 family)
MHTGDSMPPADSVPTADSMSTANTLIVTRSAFGVGETLDRLASAVAAAGNTVFARFDHSANARDVGLSMRPTQVLVFGNAKGGTPLMERAPALALDLPLRFLAWEDDAGATHLAYAPVAELARRYDLRGMDEQVAALDARLAALARLVAPVDT